MRRILAIFILISYLALAPSCLLGASLHDPHSAHAAHAHSATGDHANAGNHAGMYATYTEGIFSFALFISVLFLIVLCMATVALPEEVLLARRAFPDPHLRHRARHDHLRWLALLVSSPSYS